MVEALVAMRKRLIWMLVFLALAIVGICSYMVVLPARQRAIEDKHSHPESLRHHDRNSSYDAQP
jgi:hypothetical protein